MTRELRETVERVENRYSPQLRRQFYSLSNTDAKYRNRVLTLTFLLDRAKHRKKVILDIHRRSGLGLGLGFGKKVILDIHRRRTLLDS